MLPAYISFFNTYIYYNYYYKLKKKFCLLFLLGKFDLAILNKFDAGLTVFLYLKLEKEVNRFHIKHVEKIF